MRSLILLGLLFSACVFGQLAVLQIPASVPGGAQFDVTATIEPAQGHMVRVRLPDGSRGSYGYPKSGRAVKLRAPLEPGEYQVEYAAGGEVLDSQTFSVTPVTASLSVPASLSMLQGFEVEYEGPANHNDMIFVRDAQQKRLSYRYPGKNKTGAVTLQAPEEPGEYEVVYRTGDKILAAAPIAVKAVTATISVPASLDMRQSFEVAFQGPANHNDMIFVRDAQQKKLSYRYPGKNNTGSVTLQAPEAPGNYEVVYRTGSTILAVAPVTVGGVTASLSVPPTVPAGARVNITYQGPANHGDMILLLDAQGEKGAYGYPGKNKAGELSLTVKEELGHYRVVYRSGSTELAQASFEVVDVTAVLEAPAQVEGGLAFDVSWEAQGNRGDRINLIDPGAESRTVAHDYPVRGNPVQLTAPKKPGDYLLDYRTAGGRVLTTRPITVTPPDPEPGFLLVSTGSRSNFPSNSGVEIILDASGSMLQRIDGQRRIAIAKKTLIELVSDVIPAGTPFALRVFGHREADSCRTDLEVPLGPLDATAVSAKVSDIQAMNLARTPIADSLALVASDLAGVQGERIVILLTDGEETCEGDAALAIQALKNSGVDIRLNIVGFAIDDESLEQTFESWAALGNGSYFGAADAAQLSDALNRSVRPQFQVLSQQGSIVATSRVGDPSVPLPAGEYQLQVGQGDGSRENFKIEAGKTLRMELP